MHELIASKTNQGFKRLVKQTFANGDLINFKFILKAGERYKNMNFIFNMHHIHSKTGKVTSISGPA